MNHSPYLDVSPEVADALNEGQPVVALESTIIAHGMPYPQNLETAFSLEKIIRNQHAIPATIALMDGKIKIGLQEAELEKLATEAQQVVKTSRRDMAYVLLRKLTGATTVSATMIAASMAGIPVFATGGIGGVHRGGHISMDVSADLQELARTDVAVVCAGIKSILDLPRSMEYLETLGVPVIGYQTDELPAFYTRKSGVPVNFSLNSPEEIAGFLHIKWQNHLHGGAVIANPIPRDYEADVRMIQKAVQQALEEMEENKITGKKITPFLLSRIAELTGGKSLEANIHLVKNNCVLAARIAGAMSRTR